MRIKKKQAKCVGLKALLLLLLSPLGPALAQPLRKDLQKDFGAVGDNRHDDQAAFHRAADFFNQRARTPAGQQPAVLRIPAGTYRVGTPGPGSLASLLVLQNCRNLRIEGADTTRTVIRYADSLRYGAFDPATHQPYEAPTAFFTEWSYAVAGGTAIELLGCDNVEVRGLTLDGNSPHLLVGGHWGDTGIQLTHDGVFVSNSRRVQLRQLAVHHFGRDGVQVLNHLAKSLDDPALEGTVLENSRFDYNGRQGLSITGANGLRATNCSFSHTGRVHLPALNKPLYSNPGAGLDVEPEGGFASTILLENCRLVDNAGQGLVSDRYGTGPATTTRVVLRNCLLWGTTNWAVWLRQPGFLFERCRLYGAFENGCRAREAGWATRFVGCTFADVPYHGQPAYGPALLHSVEEARGLRLEDCRFEAAHANLLYALPAPPLDSASHFELRGVTLQLNQATAPLAGPNVLAGATLAGDVTVASGPLRPDSATTEFVLGAAGVSNSAVLLPGAHLRLLAARCRYRLPGGLQLRPGATLELGAGTTLVLPAAATGQAGPELLVAPGARLLVHRGATLVLELGTHLALAGELRLEAGGTLQQAATAEVRQLPGGQQRQGR